MIDKELERQVYSYLMGINDFPRAILCINLQNLMEFDNFIWNVQCSWCVPERFQFYHQATSFDVSFISLNMIDNRQASHLVANAGIAVIRIHDSFVNKYGSSTVNIIKYTFSDLLFTVRKQTPL